MSPTAVRESPLTHEVIHSGLALEQILGAFDRLERGGILLVDLVAPRGELLRKLQAERKGQFDWTPRPSQSGSRVEISRREAGRSALRSVNEALSWDHDRLDELEGSAFAAREHEDFDGATALFDRFAFGLRRHIQFEEELLFPEFEMKLGLLPAMGPTAVMRDEHREILDCLIEMEGAIGEANPRAESLRRALHGVLVNHNLKEERIVYPGTDRALSADERDALVAKIQAL